jgi:hypothetical protein
MARGVNGQSHYSGPGRRDDSRYKDLMDDALLAIPSISLVTDLANLFDAQKGIFVNARGQGLTWERPVSAEWIYPDGRDDFQIDAGLRIRGVQRLAQSETCFRLFFRTEYGVLRSLLATRRREFDAVDLRIMTTPGL